MTDINAADVINIQVSKIELAAVIQHCDRINDEMRRMLFNAKDGTMVLTNEQCRYLRFVIEIQKDRLADSNANPDTIDILIGLCNKLGTNPIMQKNDSKSDGIRIDNRDDSGVDNKEDNRGDNRAGNIEDNMYGNMQEAPNATEYIMHVHHNTPDPEPGRLTSIQMHALLSTKWGKPECPMRLNTKLRFEDVKDTSLYHNACILMRELIQQRSQITVTSAGNLSRKVVQAILPAIKMDEIDSRTLNACKYFDEFRVFNEQEIASVWISRHICQCANLIKLRNRSFTVTSKGIDLLERECAGKLYHSLFLAYFREFSMDSFGRSRHIDSLQATAAFSIYQISCLANKETEFKSISREIIMPAMLTQLEQLPQDFVSVNSMIYRSIIEPLEFAGLLECKVGAESCSESASLKTNSLFRKYISFSFE